MYFQPSFPLLFYPEIFTFIFSFFYLSCSPFFLLSFIRQHVLLLPPCSPIPLFFFFIDQCPIIVHVVALTYINVHVGSAAGSTVYLAQVCRGCRPTLNLLKLCTPSPPPPTPSPAKLISNMDTTCSAPAGLFESDSLPVRQ
jgi:hypothetical protein